MTQPHDGKSGTASCAPGQRPTEELSAEPVELTVESRAHGWRIDHYLSRLFPNYSRALFQKAISEGAVLVNALPVKPSRRLKVNDRVSVRLPEEADSGIAPEEIPLDILFEDDALVVINKPADMIVHPGKGNYRGTLAAALQFHFDRLSDVAGKHRPGIVHRLDRDTSGVIVVAKDNQVHDRLSRQFERREVLKEYRALVWGRIELDSDYIETFVRVNPRRREKMMVCSAGSGAREAVTFYEVIERFAGFTYVRLLPETGRTHQLRVHMQHIGHPIVADKLYGGGRELRLSDVLRQAGRVSPQEEPGRAAPQKEPGRVVPQEEPGRVVPQEEPGRVVPQEEPGRVAPEPARDEPALCGNADNGDVLIARQALHAYRLQFQHPHTGNAMAITAPLPEDFERTLHALRGET